MDYKKILVVEDEKNISDVIKAYLEKENYEVLSAFDGEKALKLYRSCEPDLVILDLMIPKVSGEKVCSIIRNTSQVPIIMLTAKSDEEDKISGLSLGADDYVVKPFSPRELVGRVKALMRRAYKSRETLAEKLVFPGDLEIQLDKFLVTKKGKEIDLTANEFKILQTLASNPKIVFTREQLIDSAFGYDYEGFQRTIDTYIKNIRQKIEDKPKSPGYIVTVYGVGYRFEG
ncbi:MAG TPA: response regulator transcription factor [Clostridia bacterium]|nr:response regulator transcription factor [Clostridia bacterium]